MQVPWSGGRLGGRTKVAEVWRWLASEALVAGKAEDGRAVAEIPKLLMTGTTEGLRLRVPKAVTETAERQPAVTETPEAVDPGIPDGPTSLSGGCGGGRRCGGAGAISTRAAVKRPEIGTHGPAVNRVLTACGVEELTVGGVQFSRLKLLSCLLTEGWSLEDCELRLASVASDV